MIKMYPGDIEQLIDSMGFATHVCPICGQPYWSAESQCTGWIDMAAGKEKHPHDKVRVIAAEAGSTDA